MRTYRKHCIRHSQTHQYWIWVRCIGQQTQGPAFLRTPYKIFLWEHGFVQGPCDWFIRHWYTKIYILWRRYGRPNCQNVTTSATKYSYHITLSLCGDKCHVNSVISLYMHFLVFSVWMQSAWETRWPCYWLLSERYCIIRSTYLYIRIYQ